MLPQLKQITSPADLPPLPEIYILWHPDCEHGAPIAWQIRQWLRPAASQGPQVFYRGKEAPAPGEKLPLPLPGETRGWAPQLERRETRSTLQIVIPLIDHHMVADPAWRWWLDQLAHPPHSATPPPPRIFLPVALSSTAFNAPPTIAQRNFLRIPEVLDLPVKSLWIDPLESPLLGSLLKPLTEALCRIVLADSPAEVQGGNRGAMPLRLFISHAKADGTGPASLLRDYIYSRTQLAAFYDENNIPYGDNFTRVLNNSLRAGETAALIAVVSDAYASRPWCRRELRTFCKPRRIRRIAQHKVAVWAMQPVLVVDILEGKRVTRGLSELATVPVLRWRADLPDSRQEETIVTTLLREVFFDGYARLVAQHLAIQQEDESGPRIILSWRPDSVTLLPILANRPKNPFTVYYPGRELSYIDVKTLKKLFPQANFLSFTEANFNVTS